MSVFCRLIKGMFYAPRLRTLLHVWTDKSVTIFMAWYNVTDRCYTLRCVHTDKNLVVQLGTTWLCDIKCVVVMVVWTVGATCVVRHFRLCDQDREPPNVGPLQKKFVWHNSLTKMLCAVWRNLDIFSTFFRLQSRQIYKKDCGCVDIGRTTTFCMTTTRFMSHNLVAQSSMTKLLSVWTHLYNYVTQ